MEKVLGLAAGGQKGVLNQIHCQLAVACPTVGQLGHAFAVQLDKLADEVALLLRHAHLLSSDAGGMKRPHAVPGLRWGRAALSGRTCLRIMARLDGPRYPGTVLCRVYSRGKTAPAAKRKKDGMLPMKDRRACPAAGPETPRNPDLFVTLSAAFDITIKGFTPETIFK